MYDIYISYIYIILSFYITIDLFIIYRLGTTVENDIKWTLGKYNATYLTEVNFSTNILK